MGCGASAKPQPAPAVTVVQPAVTAQPIAEPAREVIAQQKPAHHRKPGKFQIQLSGEWKDYDDEEDRVLKRAYLVGLPNAKFSLRGQHYEYSFTDMVQRNLGTGKERKIRPPRGMSAPPKPLLPAGPMVVITVPPGSAGTTIEVADPNNPGQKLQVNVPPGAKAGQKMAVPIPGKGETVQAVQEKQKGHSTAGKIAMGVGGVAAVGGLAVGGVILGDHLSGGAVAEAAGSALGDGAGEAMGAATAAAESAAGDVAAFAEVAAADAADVAADVGDMAADFGGEAVDWLGDAAEDAGDFIMDLF